MTGTDAHAIVQKMSPSAKASLRRALDADSGNLPSADRIDFALVGVGLRFPGNVNDSASYWQFIVDKRDAIVEVPSERWRIEEYYRRYPGVPESSANQWGGFIDNPAGFDAEFFNISKAEATAMDPQQRILLEVAWEALQNGGIRPGDIANSSTAVIMGLSNWDYSIVNVERHTEPVAYMATGNSHSMAAGRISYLLGLHGPSLTVDTACSSSLVAIHLACQSLRSGESSLALAGGVQINSAPYTGMAMSRWSALSPTGRCRSFDKDADGYVRSEGCGVVVLKRLSDALRDNDPILSVIRGSAVNHDGLTNGLTAPSGSAQSSLMRSALANADVAPETVGFIETHGTGTPLGDPVEFDAIVKTYGGDGIPCALGAVKSNFGHLEAAGGVAGVIKASLALSSGIIPPNIHFSEWNPEIDPLGTRCFIPTQSLEWPSSNEPRRAAVSSFGISGTNAHVVLEQAPIPHQRDSADRTAAAIAIRVSGSTAERVSASAAALADWLVGAGRDAALHDVACTMNEGRAEGRNQAVAVGRDREQVVARLRSLSGPTSEAIRRTVESKLRPVWLFSGQGSQWPGMGRDLIVDEPVFARELSELSSLVLAESNFDVFDMVSRGAEFVGMAQVQPALFCMQVALAELWKSNGVIPGAVIGHSMGEIAAAVVGGFLDKADAVKVVCLRSRLLSRNAGRGAMAMLPLSADDSSDLIRDYAGLDIAVLAAPNQTIVSGDEHELTQMTSLAEAKSIRVWPINVEVASHSPQVDDMLGELENGLHGIQGHRTTEVAYYSATTPESVDDPAFDAEYWVRNLRQPVHFQQAVTSAVHAGHRLFVEISPHPVLESPVLETIEEVLGGREFMVAYSMKRHCDGEEEFRTQLEMVSGALTATFGSPTHTRGRRIAVPSAPWFHTDYWVPDNSRSVPGVQGHPMLGSGISLPRSASRVWRTEVGTERNPWLGDHRVLGMIVMPAAVFIEMSMAAASEVFAVHYSELVLQHFEIEQMLVLDRHTDLTTRLNCETSDSTATIEIFSEADGDSWVRHASSTVTRSAAGHDVAQPSREDGGHSESADLTTAKYYSLLRQSGQHHGAAFAALTSVERHRNGSATTVIELPPEAPDLRFVIHPVVIDAALQSVGAALTDRSLNELADATYLPASVDSIRFFGAITRKLSCRVDVRASDSGVGNLSATTQLMDDDGKLVGELSGIELKKIPSRLLDLPLAQKLYHTRWTAEDLPHGEVRSLGDRTWILLTEDEDAPTPAGLTDAIRTAGGRVLSCLLDDERALREVFDAAADNDGRLLAGMIVFLRPSRNNDINASSVHAQDVILGLAALVRAAVQQSSVAAPRLWVVSRGGLSVNAHEPGDPGVGALKGVVKTLAFEHPDLRTTLVDLDSGDDGCTGVLDELRADSRNELVAIRAGQRYVEVLLHGELGVARPENEIRASGSYIVTGGLGGLGLAVAEWLVDKGAGRVVLNGRTAPSSEVEARLARWRETSQVVVELGDIATNGTAIALVDAAERSGLDLRGVVHAAGVLEDGAFTSMDRSRLVHVYSPKVDGALALHRATAGRRLDWWCSFSSMAAVIGSPGQAAYAAANAWLDSFADWRRAQGLPISVIDWGQWSGVGVATSVVLDIVDPLSPAEGIDAFGALLLCDTHRVGVARLRLDRAAALPEVKGTALFEKLLHDYDLAADSQDWMGPEALAKLSPDEAVRAISERLLIRVGAIVGAASVETVDRDASLFALGMDSLMAMRLKNACRWDFGVDPSVGLLMQGGSLNDLQDDISAQLGLISPPTVGSVAEPVSPSIARAHARQKARSRRPLTKNRDAGEHDDRR